MTNRERVHAILNKQPYDRMPLIHFGFWKETLEKWCEEGHITKSEYSNYVEGNEYEKSIIEKLGFDMNWQPLFIPDVGMRPLFEKKYLGEYSGVGGGQLHQTSLGVVELCKDGAGSIHAEIEHPLKDRDSWERDYKWRYKFSPERVNIEQYKKICEQHPDDAIGLHLGSLYGTFRDTVGLEGTAYMYIDDEELYDEILEAHFQLCFDVAEYVLKQGLKFDYAHFWEDICFKNGPLISPTIFKEKLGPRYKKMTDLVKSYGIDIISLDCDGLIDSLVPTWEENGINTMFPIEVGTWHSDIVSLRKAGTPELKGVGGMNKNVFSKDVPAVDAEVKRLKALIALGGYIPCPDHRIAPDAKFENVRHYCKKMKEL